MNDIPVPPPPHQRFLPCLKILASAWRNHSSQAFRIISSALARKQGEKIFLARKLRHHEDILHSGGMKSAKEGSQHDWWICQCFWIFFACLLASPFQGSSLSPCSILYSFVCSFFFVKEIPIVCNLSSMNSWWSFVFGGWSNGILLDSFQIDFEHRIVSDSTTYQHDISIEPHAKIRQREILFVSSHKIRGDKRCIM